MGRMPGQPGRIICWFRDILMGRPLDSAPWLRKTGTISPRSPAPPSLPHGPAHRLADNYYCSRDSRRNVTPPILASTHKQITCALEELSKEEINYPQISTPPTPGQGHLNHS